jgi:Zn ribbon nucleic-acid-binding protein
MAVCPVCKGRKSQLFGRNGRGVRIIECASCGWQFQDIEKKNELSNESQALVRKISGTTKKRVKRKKPPKPVSSQQEEFFKMLMIVIFISFLPIINWPFEILETFFHELSHGLVAVLAGGNIESIEVGLWGGKIWTSGTGDLHALVGWAGYPGAVVFGVLVFRVGLRATPVQGFVFILSIIVLLGSSTVMWVKDSDTVLALFITYMVFSLALIFIRQPRWEMRIKKFIQFAGLFSIMQSNIAPLYLFQADNLGDAGSLAALTNTTDNFWIFQWSIISLVGLYIAWNMAMNTKMARPATRKQKTRKTALVPVQATV